MSIPLPPVPSPAATGGGDELSKVVYEQLVLGACLLDPKEMDDAADLLTPDHFQDERNRLCFEAMLQLLKDGKPVNMMTVVDHLVSTNRFRLSDITKYCAHLMQNYPGGIDSVRSYASTLHNIAGSKETIRRLQGAIQALQSGEDPSEVIEIVTAATSGLKATLIKSAEQEMPAPLDDCSHYEQTPFPIQLLPSQVRDFCLELSEATQTPIDLSAVSALGVMASCVQGKAYVHVNNTWREPLCLFTVVAAESGERKGPVFSSLMRPIIRHEKNRRAEIEKETKKIAFRAKLLKRQYAKALDAAGKGDTSAEQEIARIEEELASLDAPRSGQLIIQDSTAEAIALAMSRNRGRIVLADSEGGFFSNIMGRYNQGEPNVSNLLKAWSNEPVRINRAKRDEPIIIDDPYITAIMSVQPTVIASLGNKSVSEQGFHPRWLFSLPKSMVGERKAWPESMTRDGIESYEGIINHLLEIPDAYGEPMPIRLSETAESMIRGFMKEIDEECREGGRYHPIKGWALKAHGQATRIAGIFHLARYGGSSGVHEIDGPTAERAVLVMRYFLQHAFAAYRLMGLETYSVAGDAHRLLDWMISTYDRYFTETRLQRACKNWFGATRKKRAVELLVERGWLIRQGGEGRTGPGRPKGFYYLLNQLAFEARERYKSGG